MATQSISASPNWTSLQGRVLEGGYELEECFATQLSSASFEVRVLGDRFARVIAQVFTPNSVSAEQFALWDDSLELRSPNLSTPVAVSKLDWDGLAFPYLLLHKPDETLAEALGERVLNADETRDLLRSILPAFQYLHTRGFIHSRLSPDDILALGTTIQLSTTGIRRINTPLIGVQTSGVYKAPESAVENLTPAADLWCAGATAYQVLTGKRYADGSREQAESLPVPFNSIVYRCLDPDPQTRCSLSDVEAMLRGEQLRPPDVKTEPAAPVPVPDVTPAPSHNGTSAIAPPPPAILVRPVIVSKANALKQPRPRLAPPAKPVFRDVPPRNRLLTPEAHSESPRLKFWSYAILGLLLVVGLLWLTRPRTEKPLPAAKPGAAAPAASSSERTQAPGAVPGSQSRVVGPGSPAQSPAPAPPSAHARSAPDSGTVNGNIWRVVVYTFTKQDDAQKQAAAIGKKHPDLHPEVLPAAATGPFLVVLGSSSNREEANRLRQTARAEGLPRDAYVQNFKQ